MHSISRSHSSEYLLVQERIAKEVQHGRYLLQHGAGEIWNWESPAGKLRWARRVKMLTAHISPAMNVLELGCGTGYFTNELAMTGAAVTAIDLSPHLLEVARGKCPTNNVRFMVENAYSM